MPDVAGTLRAEADISPPLFFLPLSRSLCLFLSPSRYIPLSSKAPFMIVVEKCVVGYRRTVFAPLGWCKCFFSHEKNLKKHPFFTEVLHIRTFFFPHLSIHTCSTWRESLRLRLLRRYPGSERRLFGLTWPKPRFFFHQALSNPLFISRAGIQFVGSCLPGPLAVVGPWDL